MLKVAYAFFIGILLAIFVGVGINAFYPEPTAPEYPRSLEQKSGSELSYEDRQAQNKFDDDQKAYMESLKPYNRNVSIITLIAATVFVTVSLVFEKRIKVIADGVMMGGIFTLIYSLGRSFGAQDSRYTFVVVTIGLIIAIGLGYMRFLRESKSPKKTRR